MVHFQLLLAFALVAASAASLAYPPVDNPYELRGRERGEKERQNRPWRLDRVQEGYRRVGLERERMLEREHLQRERLGAGKEGLYGPTGYGLQQDKHLGYGNGHGTYEGYGYGLGHGPSYSLVPWVEPTKGVLSNGHSGNVELQNKIVRETYSPTYYQPEYIVDYRFLRSGGRAFTQGPGGQIIILPRGVKQVDQSGHNSYDRLIEDLQIEEEHRGKLPYRVVVLGSEYAGYRRDGKGESRREGLGERRDMYYGREGLGDRKGEYYGREILGERKGDYGRDILGERKGEYYGLEGLAGKREGYGYSYERIPRGSKAETQVAEPVVEAAKDKTLKAEAVNTD